MRAEQPGGTSREMSGWDPSVWLGATFNTASGTVVKLPDRVKGIILKAFQDDDVEESDVPAGDDVTLGEDELTLYDFTDL